MKCSVTKAGRATCFTDEQLAAIVEAYAAHSGDAAARGLGPEERYRYLLERVRGAREDARALLRQDFVQSIKKADRDLYYELMLDTFAPRGPQCCEPYRDSPDCCPWLSNFDIMRVMYQYQRKYPQFLFLDAPSADFRDHDIWQMSSTHFRFEDIAARYTQFAAVINLDLRHEGGSHWVMLFCDIPRRSIYFFDSTGNSPYYRRHDEPYIVQFMLQVASKMTGRDYSGADLRARLERGVDGLRDDAVSILINRFRHQTGTTECGVYAIHTIVRLLQGEDFLAICRNKIPDEQMARNRRLYFA